MKELGCTGTHRKGYQEDILVEMTYVEIALWQGGNHETLGQGVLHTEINKCNTQKVATSPGIRETEWRALWLEIMNKEPVAGDEIRKQGHIRLELAGHSEGCGFGHRPVGSHWRFSAGSLS